MSNKSAYNFTDKEIEAYNKGWSKFMVKIFCEQIEQLKISDSRALMDSIKEISTTGRVTTIEHRFLEYGLYVAAGVGNGFFHGNGGDLEFMMWGSKKRQVGSGVAETHYLSPKFERIVVKQGKNKGKEAALTSGKHRIRRDWVMKKYYYSLRRLNETNAKFYGDAYQGMTATFLDALFAGDLTATQKFANDDVKIIRSNRF